MLCHYISIVEFIAAELFQIQFPDDVFTNSLILTLQREFYPMEAGSKIRLDNEDHMFYPSLNPNRKSISCYRFKNPFQAVFRKNCQFGMKPDAKVMLAGCGTQGETEK